MKTVEKSEPSCCLSSGGFLWEPHEDALDSVQHGGCDADGYLGQWPSGFPFIEKDRLILTLWGIQPLPVFFQEGVGGIIESLIREWQ